MTTPTPSPDRWSRQLIGPFTVRHVVTLLVALAGVGVLLAVLTTPLSTPTPSLAPQPGASFVIVGEVTEGLTIGQRAPELEGVRDGQTVGITDLEGVPVTLAELRGGPVWVNFWASWCPPCQEELPVLRAIDRAYRDRGLSVVGVSVQESSPENVAAYLAPYDIGYTIAFDGRSEVFRAWLGFGLPTHYFLDADGVIRLRHYGPLSLTEATAIVDGLLAEAEASPSAAPSPAPSSTPSQAAPTG